MKTGGLRVGVYRFSSEPIPINANTLINLDFHPYPEIIEQSPL